MCLDSKAGHGEMKRHGTVEKYVGETPLEALERFRVINSVQRNVPLAYAGRLDPMASGILLILIGDECRQQEKYHAFDKAYDIEVVFGVGSDTGDVLGLIRHDANPPHTTEQNLKRVRKDLTGNISHPYPHFSSKTVNGKPLHTWTLEGRIDEIEIPVKHSRIYKLKLKKFRDVTKGELIAHALAKIEIIPKVVDERKVLGADFRRDGVRSSWKYFRDERTPNTYMIASIHCICSSGTYMRSLAEEMGKRLGSNALALSIHRTRIGSYASIGPFGLWYRYF